ncbi:MAG TPA: S8 family serine peptidase [Saprospiraceae bacterium]|nr:S8 family serine peptidase [Saprospiraceae bacterium]
MASQNYLYRGGEQIAIEKEDEFFTVMIPDAQQLEEITKMEPVEHVQQVFENVYKVQTEKGELDEVMQRLRTDDRAPGICHHAYHPEGDEATRYYLTDLLTVAFQPGLTFTAIERILEQHGLKFIRTFGDEALMTFLLQVTKSAGKNPVKVSEDLQSRPEVLFAEPNLVNRFQSFYTPLDPLFKNQWHLKSTRGVELLPDAHVDAARAWSTTRGKRGIIVAVIDDGFDLTHPDLQGEGKVVFPRDFVDGDEWPLPVRARGDYHGTPCAGIAIAEENGDGAIGVAPNCAFMPVRFGMTADDRLLYDIFDYTGRRADVISCSWGPVPVFAPLSSLLSQQLTQLSLTGGPRGKGCIIVFAAGNYNAPIRAVDNVRFQWRHATQGLKETHGALLNGHAAHPSVVTVAASTSMNSKAAYSNWGKEINLCAPSDNMHPLDPQIRQPGRSIWTISNDNRGRRYTDKFGGTSAAAPIVAGVAALVWAAQPELSADQVKEILYSTTDKITDPQPDPVFQLRKGFYDENGHSEWFGYGKVNAYKAVQQALLWQKNTDDTGVLEKPSCPTEGIHIAAALVNPVGRDQGREMIALFNATNATIKLDDWEIRNRAGRSEQITDMHIEPGQTLHILLTKVPLSNLGGSIELLNPAGVSVSLVHYSMWQGMREGWWIKF